MKKHISLSITERCNLNCIYCFERSKCQIEYSAQVEHPDRFELNSLTAKTEQSSRRD